MMPFRIKWRCKVGSCIHVWFRDEGGAGSKILEIISIYK